MKRRRFASVHSGAAAGFALIVAVTACWAAHAPPFAALAAQAPPTKQPNVIVILADDLGAETLGSYGGTSYATPELDRLAVEGMRFDNGHSQPLCTPTRVKIMTGLHNFRNYRHFAHLDSSDVTFAHVLRQAGYDTTIAGKWQLANNGYVVQEGTYPEQAGFDRHRLWQVRREGRGSRYWRPTLITNGVKETFGDSDFGPDLINDFVLDTIERHAPPGSRPFFIYYPMVLPHDPFVTTPHQPDAEGNQERFAAMVAYMDFLVGRVRAKLIEHQLAKDTLLLFIGDNGTSTRISSMQRAGGVERAIRGGKGSSLQTGTHVPYIAWWPGTIGAGQVNRSLVDVGDVFPTLVEAAGARLPERLQLDGTSLLEVLRTGEELGRDGLFIHYEPHWFPGPPVRYAFDRRWKLTDDGRLFDLVDDPEEQAPLALSRAPSAAAASVEKLAALLSSKGGALRTVGAWRAPPPGAPRQRYTPPLHRPNILLFIADDMTYSDAGALGNRRLHTPNIDRLAQAGATFTHAFTASPMCSPTRHMIYNGRYPVSSGAYPNHAEANVGTRSVAHYLAELGYRVGLAGKSHVAPQEAYPFEPVSGRELDWQRIESFIGRDRRQPFALFIASTEPHQPWNKGDASRYDPATLELPPYFADTPETRDALSRYYAEITFMDAQLGRALDLLEERGLELNTLTMFFTEQGMGAPFAKWTLYDAGVRGSLVARWPGRIPAGQESAALIQVNDLLPTWIEVAGGWSPAAVEGRSLLSVLLDPTAEHREVVYGIQTTTGILSALEPYPIRSIRDRRYKLIWNLAPDNAFTNILTEESRSGIFSSWRASADPGAQQLVTRYQHRPELELYDLEADPHELDDLASSPGHRERLREMLQQLKQWMAEQGDEGLRTEVEAPSHQVPRLRANAPR